MIAASLQHGFLRSLLSQPTAPFREHHVDEFLSHEFKRAEVPHFHDRHGNLIVGAASEREYRAIVSRKDTDPVRIFMAHMDHPGFHGQSWKNPNLLEVKWLGGAPVQHLEGAPVWLSLGDGLFGEGHLVEAKLLPSGRSIESGVVEIPLDDRLESMPDPQLIYGGFRFKEPVWEEGARIFTRAADDLIGCFAIASLAIEIFAPKNGRRKKTGSIPFLGLLTRAEEVGFIGAISHFELGWLKAAKRPLVCISLEASRALPGAEIGKGPIVRLGDRATVFDPGALRVLAQSAQESLPDRHQKRIMDGGSCEATAATAYGIPAIGISVPLGNYHNQSFEGGTGSRGDLGPAPEFVHLGDVQGMLDLCRALMKPKLAWGDPWGKTRKEFKSNLAKYKALLKANPAPKTAKRAKKPAKRKRR